MGRPTACGDGEELFDIYDEAGRPIGIAPRSEVHARGYWHRSFHCWLTRRAGGRRLVLFQRRQADKDTFPGCLDITAAGHLAAGESVRDAARELEEELGVAAPFESLVPLGETRMEKSGMAGGRPFVDREISDVFALLHAPEPASLRLQAEEVAGVYEADLEAMIGLFEGETTSLIAAGVEASAAGGLTPASLHIRAADFVPRPYAYYAGVFRALLRHM